MSEVTNLPPVARGRWLLCGTALLAILTAAAPAGAQSLGLLFGFSSTTVAGPIATTAAQGPNLTRTSVSRREGSIFGIFAGTSLQRAVALEVDGLLSFRGAAIQTATISPATGQIIGATIAADRLIYLDVPVLARVTVGSLWRRDVHITAGPAFGLRIGAKDVATNAGLGSLVKRFDPSFIIGGGMNVGSALIQARYEWSLQNIANGPGLLGSGTMKNHAFQIAAVLRLY